MTAPARLSLMTLNFFESLGFADVERIHSQVLAWLFESEVLCANKKSQILAQLVGRDDDYEVLKVTTEHERIDILIETASSIIAIENKIKITEHDDQLRHYAHALEGRTKPRIFLYLSLVPDAISASNWTTRTYADLLAALRPHVFGAPSNFGEHAFNEYVEAVDHLTDIVMEFERDHTKFLNVFTDGSLTKLEKFKKASNYTAIQDSVRTNQLETALQRFFLARIRSRILPASTECWIRESHGVANINIVIATRSISGLDFQWAVQFQGEAAKLNCYARDYENSTFDQLPAEIKADFGELAKKLGLRRPNLGRSKAYISLSKKLAFKWSDPFEIIVESYRTAYAELSKVGRSMASLHGTEKAPQRRHPEE